MTANTLTLTTRPGGRWISLRGDLNYATVDEARSELREAIAPGDAPIVLDLREVSLLASVGVNLLIDAALAQPARRCVVLANGLVAEVLALSGAARWFDLVKTEAEAHAAIESTGAAKRRLAAASR